MGIQCNQLQQKYKQSLNYKDNKIVINLRLQSIKKYQKYIAQIENKLSNLSDFFFAFVIFVNKSRINYIEKIQFKKHLRFK